MGLYKRPNSPYWWMVLSAPGRKPKRESTRIPVKAPSAVQRAELKRQAEGVYARAQAAWVLEATGAGPKPAITLSSYLDWYERHVTAHKKGAIRERSMLKRLRTDLGQLELQALTRERIIEWRTRRARVVQARSVNRELDVLKAALSAAVPRYLAASPARGLPRLKAPETAIFTLSHADEQKLLSTLSAADQAVVITALDTLLRAGDLLRLEWIDDRGDHLTARDPKTGTPHKVPISRRVRAALDALPRTGTHARYIFGHRRPKNGRSVELWRLIDAGAAAAGITTRRGAGITFHSLRHTGATRMLAAGVDLRTVQQIGGWKNLRQLVRYLHPSPETHAAVNLIAPPRNTPDAHASENAQNQA